MLAKTVRVWYDKQAFKYVDETLLRCKKMKKGKIEVICGNGKGKTAMALGRAVRALTEQKDVIMIQFLKGSQSPADSEVIQRLEPQFKVFRFEKESRHFEELTEAEKEEEIFNIRNGFNYARKVLGTGECELLILDEVLGLLDLGIITREELESVLDCREEADVILTGKQFSDSLKTMADQIDRIEQVAIDN